MSENERVALVTGASTGIGASIATHLLDGGYTVLNLSRRRSPQPRSDLIDVEIDLTDVGATRETMGELAVNYPITTLVHNAGVIRPDLIEDVKLDDVDYVTRLHIHASITMIQAVLDTMKAAHFGRVVLISSRATLGLETRSGYGSTKAGQLVLARTWALELGRHGITVNSVAPGPVVTDMFTELVPDDETAQKIAASIPVKRLGRPEDVARAVMFLVAPENSFITGQCLFVCGGASLGSLAL